MCRITDHFEDEGKVIFNLITHQIDEFQSSVLTILNLNKFFELETERMGKIVNSIISDYGLIFARVIIGIEKLIKLERYEECKTLYDRMNYLFRHIFIVELKMEGNSDEFDIDMVNENFNDLFKTISNHINQIND
jgi:hypothetical protein